MKTLIFLTFILFSIVSADEFCVECVMDSGGSKGFPTTGMGGGFNGAIAVDSPGIGVLGGGVPKNPPEDIAKAYAQNQFNYYIATNSSDTIDLDKFFDSVDPKSELSRADREELVANTVENSKMPYYDFNPEDNTGKYVVNPSIDRLIRSSEASGYQVKDSYYKAKNLSEAFIANEGDVDGFIKYLKDNYSGEKLSDISLKFAKYSADANNIGSTDGFYKMIKLALEEGGLSNEKVLRLIRQEVSLMALEGKDTPISDLISENIAVVELEENSRGDTLACEIGNRVYNNTKYKEKIDTRFKQMQGAVAHMGNTDQSISYEHQEVMNTFKKSNIRNGAMSLEALVSLGADISKKCRTGKSPLEYLQIAHSEGLLDFLDDSQLGNLGVIEKDCEEGHIEVNLPGICDSFFIANMLERQTNRNLKMSERREDSSVNHIYSDGSRDCNITILDRIVRSAGNTVEREVEVSLNSDEVILRTKSMKSLKEAIKRLYDK